MRSVNAMWMTWTLCLSGVVVSGCATHPLGADWGKLKPEARDARVLKTLTQLIEGGVSGDGDPFLDRRVIACDVEGVAYEPADGVGPVSSLSWADVRSITGQPETTLPSRPETLFLYLVDDAPSTKTVHDLTQPVLSKVGLVSSYLLLRNRPRRSRVALIRCLEHLRKRRMRDGKADPRPKAEPPPKPKAGVAPKAKPEPRPTPTVEPEPKPLDDVEAKLQKLKAWKEKGLITEQEYEAKKTELLKGL